MIRRQTIVAEQPAINDSPNPKFCYAIRPFTVRDPPSTLGAAAAVDPLVQVDRTCALPTERIGLPTADFAIDRLLHAIRDLHEISRIAVRIDFDDDTQTQ
jgi:hypothetical protein